MVGWSRMIHEAVVKKSQEIYRFLYREGVGWLDLVGFGLTGFDWVGLNGSDW
jgi:hypothetical protein